MDSERSTFTFNFLASLINGNNKLFPRGKTFWAFNFLASLINGNFFDVG